MLFYDIVLTFGEEVEKVWKQRFTGVTVLWFLVCAIPNMKCPNYLKPYSESISFAIGLYSHYRL